MEPGGNELKEFQQDSLEELGLFMDSVPFQTLSTITENLEGRLDNLSDTMFKAPSELAAEGAAPKGSGRRGSVAREDPTLDEGSRPGSQQQGRRAAQAAFMTDVDGEESRPPSRRPAMSIEDVEIDYSALIQGPQPPPNCKTEDVLAHVSEGILEQWQHPHWNTHFLSPLSVAICNDFFWYFFLQELALARVQLGDPVAAASQAKLEPSQQHIKAQEVMFRRVSDHYMELFWKVGLTMHTDEFFDRYPEALCSTIHLAFESGLPDSAYQFGDVEFQGRLKDIFGRWTTGLQPRRLRSELKLSRPEDDMPSYSTPGPARTKTSKRNYGFFNAVGHSPMVASYMDRHGLKCQIGGTESRHPVAVHRLRRLEVAMNKDPVKWRKKRRTPLKVAPRINTATKPKATSSAHMMTSVMPQIHSTCGMGTFSQKKVDEEFLKYLFPYG